MGWFDRVFYSQYSNNWDDSLFRSEILAHLKGGAIVLDIGAGAGIIPQMNFRGIAGKVYGIDPDQRVVDNPYVDEGVVGSGESLPYADESFDMVFADNVLEHLENPDKVFREIHRVLKRGGLFLAKTPNKYHYMPLVSSLSPHWFHQWVNKMRGRDASDTFPTCYKVNSERDINRVASRSNFEVIKIKQVEGRPEYLRKLLGLNMIGLMYERLVNSSAIFRQFRILLVIVLKKK